MSDLDPGEVTLFMAPGTCARVTAVALFEAGVAFEPKLIRFMKAEHRSPEYLALNPLGKVPALRIDGAVLTETVAILSYLASRFPEARLLPAPRNAIEEAHRTADLCFCAATLHPIVTRIRIPTAFAETPSAQASVYERAVQAMRPHISVVEDRLDRGPWWYGEDWSAMDAYIGWVWFRITGAGFDAGPYPRLTDHARRLEARPAVARALAMEAAAEAQLAAEGLVFRPPAPPTAGSSAS